MSIVARFSVQRQHDTIAGAFSLTALGIPVVVIAALASGAGFNGANLADLWPFLVIGVFVPGMNQLAFLYAVRMAGPSRTGLMIGTFPILAALIAVIFLDEPLQAALVVGTMLIVLGGVLLTGERSRPVGFRALGLVFAFAVAVGLGSRDNIVRWAAPESPASILTEISLIVVAASAGLLVFLVIESRGLVSAMRRARASFLPYAPTGLVAIALTITIVLALERGRVTVVSPLAATQALWAVALAALVFGRRESIGWRLVLAAIVVTLGSVLVSVTR
jgi:drug/metabolite transporter (DMT)-like permease